ncbi:MAG: hypothetical protein FJW56_11855 [Actinobacteria bacterium]|nr:hypothetical protein [Actinomycetota bacterium]
MKKDILKFFSAQRNIFGICPHSGEFFRLSDCKIFLKGKPKADWMDQLDLDNEKLDKLEEKIAEMEAELREIARKKGRINAAKIVKRIDPIFTPRKLNPDDAKVIFHPIDFLVFNGMKDADEIKNLIFLDRELKSKEQREVQSSIEKAVNKNSYEWITLRIGEDGSVNEE